MFLLETGTVNITGEGRVVISFYHWYGKKMSRYLNGIKHGELTLPPDFIRARSCNVIEKQLICRKSSAKKDAKQ